MRTKKRLSISGRKALTGWVFSIPFLIGFFLFFLVPVIHSGILSFHTITAGPTMKFVGWQHYYDLFFTNAEYIPKLKESLLNLLIDFPCILLFSFFIATILNQRFHGRTVARAVFFLPVIIASGVVMDLMRSDSIQVPLFTAVSEGGSGLIDFQEILENLNMPESVNAIFTTFFGNVFNLIWNCGIQTVLFIAGLQAIPSTLYEVSRVEGATAWEEFWFITFPALGRVTLLVLIYTMIELFVSIDNPIMKQAYAVIQDQQIYDRSSAMLWAYFVVVGLLLSVVFWLYWRFLLKRWE